MRIFPRRAMSLVSSGSLLIPTLVTAGVVAALSAPAAVASAPTPLPPTLLWQEDFENGTGSSPTPLVGGYTGEGGVTYTADAEWADPDLCNGIVLNGQSSGAYQGCIQPSMDQLRLLAGYIGEHNGDYAADDAVQNHVVAAYTNETPGRLPPDVIAQTSQAVTLSPSAQQNRFITASVWVAATNCRLDDLKDPFLKFQWSSNGTSWTDFGDSVNVCRLPSIENYPPGTDGPTVVTQVFANGGNLRGLPTTSLYVRVINTNEIDDGNDMAWDNLAIYEGTPTLTKEFNSSTLDSGSTYGETFSNLVFTITNSADLSAKAGIAFNDILPAGMRIDSPLDFGVSCPTGTVTAIPGSNAVAVSGVSLPYGGEDPSLSSCTVNVYVTADPTAIYTNDNTNITSPIAILPDTSATLTVVDGAPPGAGATDDALSGPYSQPLSFTPLANDSAGTPTSPYASSSLDRSGMRLCDVAPNQQTPPNCTETLVITDDGEYELNPTTGVVVFTPTSGFIGDAETVRYQVPVDYSFGPNSSDLTDHVEVFDALISPRIGPPGAPDAPAAPASPVALNYSGNGGTCTAPTQMGNAGTSVNTNDGTTCLRPGFEFTGWNTNAAGTGTAYRPGSPITLTGNTTLFAMWRPPSIAAVNDINSTPVNTPVSGSLAANDGAPAGSTFTKLTDPSNGTVVVNPSGSYTYTPNRNFVGVDRFTYQVCMPAPNQTVCATATATITVVGPGQPVASPVVKRVPVGSVTPLKFATKSSITSGSVRIAQHGTSKWGDRVNVPGKGVWILKGKKVTFTPAPGFLGRSTIRYRVIDGDGKAAFSTFTAIRVARPGTINSGVV